MSKNDVIAFDIGGTHLRAAVVNGRGELLGLVREPVEVKNGPRALISQIARWIIRLNADYKTRRVGIGCAGPLDPTKGVLLDPTNFITEGKSWGQFELVRELKKRLPLYKIKLENDAACAVLGESWMSGGVKNLTVMTLGTGVGVGVICNGELLRSGRYLHPEASHIPINAFDKSAPCGCGLYGCIEAYLSGVNFTRRLSRRWGEPDLTGEELVLRARNREDKVNLAFREYGEHLAQAIQAYVVLFSSEEIVLSGGFSASAKFFLPTTKTILKKLLKRRRVGLDLLPKIRVSKYGDDLGLLGAAVVARSLR